MLQFTLDDHATVTLDDHVQFTLDDHTTAWCIVCMHQVQSFHFSCSTTVNNITKSNSSYKLKFTDVLNICEYHL